MKYIAIDFETAPLFDEAEKTFNPDDVKLGNIKDEKKRIEKIEQARDKHLEGATLEPETSYICAFGIKWENGEEYYAITHEKQEKELIEYFWKLHNMAYNQMMAFQPTTLAWNMAFDKKMIARRSWKNRVPTPYYMTDRYYKGWACAMDAYCLHEYGKRISLKNASKYLGCNANREYDTTGANFHLVLKKDKEKALQYLRDDVNELWDIIQIIL